MLLLVLDTETTGLQHADPPSELIEVAACIYSVNEREILATIQFIVPNESGTNAAQHINNIPPSILNIEPFNLSVLALKEMFSRCDFVVAHNSEFDKHFVERKWPELAGTKEWICSQNDLKFPKTRKSKVLTHIAVDHGVMPANMHRALGDVQTLTSLLFQAPDLEEQIHRAQDLKKNGKLYTVSLTKTSEPLFNERKDLLKELGFKWNGGTKMWSKMMTEKHYDGLKEKYGEVFG
jgi:DNA polymerase III alpha subunit (gram-positive type)